MSAAALRAIAPPKAARVLIVDDSAVARAVIARVVDASDRFMVVGVATHVRGALEFLRRSSVDYILLDIELPGVDGLTALPDLISAGGDARVLVVSSSAADGATTTVQALAFGAADTLVKPEAGALSGRFAAALIEKLERLAEPGVPAAVPPPMGIGQVRRLTRQPRSRRSATPQDRTLFGLRSRRGTAPARFSGPLAIGHSRL